MATPSAPPPPVDDAAAPKPSTSTGAPTDAAADVAMEDAKPAVVEEEPLPDDIANGTPEDIMLRVRLIQNELKVRAK